MGVSIVEANAARVNGSVYEEIETAMDQHFPRCENPTRLKVYDLLANVIAQASGRIFVGPEVCRDQNYLECSVEYSLQVFSVVNAVRRLRPWLRPIFANGLPEVQRIRSLERKMKACVEPIIRKRQDAERSDPTWQKPDDLLQWMMTRAHKSSATDRLEYITKQQLLATFAAIHTTTMSTVNVLYTLAATPEYVPALREEIRSVVSENDGVLTVKALQKMNKLDSYMREVSSCFPPGLGRL